MPHDDDEDEYASTSRLYSWCIETTLPEGQLTADDLAQAVTEFREEGRASTWLLDASYSEGADPSLKGHVIAALEELAKSNGLERAAVVIPNPLARAYLSASRYPIYVKFFPTRKLAVQWMKDGCR